MVPVPLPSSDNSVSSSIIMSLLRQLLISIRVIIMERNILLIIFYALKFIFQVQIKIRFVFHVFCIGIPILIVGSNFYIFYRTVLYSRDNSTSITGDIPVVGFAT